MACPGCSGAGARPCCSISLIGYLILKLPISAGSAKWASWLGLAGLLMPLGILAEVYLGAPFYFVLIGGIAIVAAMVVLGLAIWRADLSAQRR